MYDIAICDDSVIDRTHMKEQIQNLAQGMNPVRIHEYDSGQELLQAINEIHFSLVFLDVQMAGMDGAETARRIRQIDNNLVLVFCTGKVEPSPESFVVQPYRYIKKNMANADKSRYIKEALTRMVEVESTPILTAKHDGRRLLLKPDDIVYIEKYLKTTRVHLSSMAKEKYGIRGNETEVRISDKLENLYEILKPYGFGYPHSSYIINFKYLMFCTNTDLKLDIYKDLSFKITRSKAPEFNMLKSAFMNGKYASRRDREK